MPKEIYKDFVEIEAEYGDGVEVIAEMTPHNLSKILASVKYLIAVSMYEGSFKKGLSISIHELRHALGDNGGGRVGVLRDPISQEPINWFYQSIGSRTPEEKAKIASNVGLKNMSRIDRETYTKALEKILEDHSSKT